MGYGKKRTFEEVKAYVESQGETLIDTTFTNGYVKQSIVCGKCKKIYKVTYNNFYYHGTRCSECSNKFRAKKRMITYKQTKKDIEREAPGYKVIEGGTNYKNNTSKIKVQCPKKHTLLTSRDNFINRGRRCRKCYENRASKNNSMPFDVAAKRCKKLGFELLKKARQINARSKIKCNHCGYKFNIPLTSIFHKKSGCRSCKSSYNERHIHGILKKLKKKKLIFDYESEIKLSYYFPKEKTCKSLKELSFDFIVFTNNGYCFLIEPDGIQHFKEVEFFGGKKAYEGYLSRDIIKSKHCRKYGIPLLRISHNNIDQSEKLIEKLIRHSDKNSVNKSYLYYSSKNEYKVLINKLK